MNSIHKNPDAWWGVEEVAANPAALKLFEVESWLLVALIAVWSKYGSPGVSLE